MKPVIFFDLDGVLADFVEGAFRLHGKSLPPLDVRWDFCSQLGFAGPNDPAFWDRMGYEFWLHLEPYADGFSLLKYAEALAGKENVGLLTSPCDTAGCVEGKRSWVHNHLPDYKRRVFVGSAKHLFAGPGKVLVDDHDANVDAFAAAGGLVVQPARPWNRKLAFCRPDGSFDVFAACDQLEQAWTRAVLGKGVADDTAIPAPAAA